MDGHDDAGDTTGQLNLDVMYARGSGVPKDYAEAVKWYRMAAEQGHAKAQNILGVKCDNGDSVPEDDVRAHAWYNLAAEQGYERAVKARKRLRERMTAKQIAQAERVLWNSHGCTCLRVCHTHRQAGRMSMDVSDALRGNELGIQMDLPERCSPGRARRVDWQVGGIHTLWGS